MTDVLNNIKGFVDYVRTLKGDEKGEAIWLFRLEYA
jgi:hypothetical protein